MNFFTKQTAWKRCKDVLGEPFTAHGRLNRRLLALFAALVLMAAVNVMRHHPRVQYDNVDHERNIEAYAKGHFPKAKFSEEYFSPPLPGLLPALWIRVRACEVSEALLVARWLNVPLFAFMVFFFLKLLKQAGDDDGTARLFGMILLGLLPVVYRSFSMVRGEPFIAALALPAAWLAWRTFADAAGRMRHAVLLGLCMGGIALSRQWGLLLLLAFGAFAGLSCLIDRTRVAVIFRRGLVAAALGLVVCGWFYLHLHQTYGSITAFNNEANTSFSLTNRPVEFYTGTGRGRLFTKPYRGSFDQQFGPVFDADTWGDYWGYYLVYGKDTRSGRHYHGYALNRILGAGERPDWLSTNIDRMPARMGRANAAAVVPSLLLLGGLAVGLRRTLRWLRPGPTRRPGDAVAALSVLCVALSLAGYFWWLLMYRSTEGSTIKATYMVQVFPFLALLGGLAARTLVRRHGRWFWVLGIPLAISALWILPLCFSRFT